MLHLAKIKKNIHTLHTHKISKLYNIEEESLEQKKKKFLLRHFFKLLLFPKAFPIFCNYCRVRMSSYFMRVQKVHESFLYFHFFFFLQKC